MSVWTQSPALPLYRVSWRCSDSGGEGRDGGWGMAPALLTRVPPAGKTSFRPRILGQLLLPDACRALATPTASCHKASWTSYSSNIEPWPKGRNAVRARR
jgi:hypothetical protein